MSSKFDLRKYVSEFVDYANIVRPWDSSDGIFSMQIDFSLVRGRLCFVATVPDCACICTDSSPFLMDVHCMLNHSVCDLNTYNGFSDLGKNRTFVLSVEPDKGGLVYGIGNL